MTHQEDTTPTASPGTASKFTRRTALTLGIGLVAAACGGSSDTINLGESGLTPPAGDSGVDTSGAAGERVNFVYGSLDDGSELEFTDLATGPIVINFLASWCATCVAELPEFETVSQNFANEVQFLGLAVQDDIVNTRLLLGETGVTFPVGVDQPGSIFAMFGGLGMPTTVFISADGEVLDVHTGVLSEASLTDAIQENFGITA